MLLKVMRFKKHSDLNLLKLRQRQEWRHLMFCEISDVTSENQRQDASYCETFEYKNGGSGSGRSLHCNKIMCQPRKYAD